MAAVGAAFTVRFLRNSDQISIVRNIIKEDGSGAGLFQSVDTISGTVAPSWKNAAGQPIIDLSLRSAYGYPTTIKKVTWYYDGTEIAVTLNGETWVAATVSGVAFKARETSDGHFQLRICSDIASSTQVANKQISYNISYVSNGKEDTIQGSIDVLIQQAGSNSYLVQITTDRVELSEAEPTATLTMEAYYGTQKITVGQNGYTVKWFNGSTVIANQTAASLNVNRDMVNGGNFFIVKLYKDGVLVGQSGQRISDIADEYQLVVTPVNNGYITKSSDAVFAITVLRNSNEIEIPTPSDGSYIYTYTVYNAMQEETRTGKTNDNITITAEDCKFTVNNEYVYSDCDVEVTATI